MTETDWLELNQANWNDRTPIHLASDFYDIESFKAGATSLQPEEVADLGDVSGRKLVHLQCHIGLDTLSWGRLGAKVTGLDFSGPAVVAARDLAREIGVPARFEVGNVYDAVQVLRESYDIVYTGIGALCWIPDLKRWAEVVAQLTNPGGEFYLLEFHPVEWMLAEDSLRLAYSCFTPPEGLPLEDAYTYTDGATPLANPRTVQWCHPLSEVIMALMNVGFTLKEVEEWPESVIQAHPFMEQTGAHGRWRMPANGPQLPLMYKIRAVKS